MLDYVHKFYANIEWTKMMDAWVFFCFGIEGFEIFDTVTMGLGKLIILIGYSDCKHYMKHLVIIGLKTTRTINMNELSSKIAGFLGLVDMQQFIKLQELMYPSLYHFDVEQPLPDNVLSKRAKSETYYCILFGPLALCNTSKGVETRFCHFDNRLGDPLLWKVNLSIMNEDGECRQRTCTSFESFDSFSVSDGKRRPDRNNYAPYGVQDMKDLRVPFIRNDKNSYTKSKLFVKVILHLRHTKKFETLKYSCGDEIFIAYKLMDELVG